MRSGPVLTSLKPYRVVMVLAGTACWSTGCISFSLKELVEVSLLVQGSHKTDLDYFLMFSLTHMEARESVPLFLHHLDKAKQPVHSSDCSMQPC